MRTERSATAALLHCIDYGGTQSLREDRLRKPIRQARESLDPDHAYAAWSLRESVSNRVQRSRSLVIRRRMRALCGERRQSPSITAAIRTSAFAASRCIVHHFRRTREQATAGKIQPPSKG